MTAAPRMPRRFTAAEYLMIEREAPYKSEFICGEIYAMAGASPNHNRITVNITREVSLQLKGNPCEALSNDTKVRTTPEGLFAYPDLTIVCGAMQFHDTKKDVLLNPIALFEILSPSTAAFDRGEKFRQYQELESLRDYVLIAQNRPFVEHFAWQDDGRWLLTTADGMEAAFTLSGVDITLSLAEIYDKVVFAEESPLTLTVE